MSTNFSVIRISGRRNVINMDDLNKTLLCFNRHMPKKPSDDEEVIIMMKTAASGIQMNSARWVQRHTYFICVKVHPPTVTTNTTGAGNMQNKDGICDSKHLQRVSEAYSDDCMLTVIKGQQEMKTKHVEGKKRKVINLISLQQYSVGLMDFQTFSSRQT